MFLDAFKKNSGITINPSLLWEYDASKIDYQNMRDVIVQRVIERGWPNDWYAILNLYGIEGIRSAIKNIPYLNNKDMNFVSHQFKVPLSAMKCYKKKQLAETYWNS
jgi:hypothetical protein